VLQARIQVITSGALADGNDCDACNAALAASAAPARVLPAARQAPQAAVQPAALARA
jgi:hypothetical protein